LKGKSIKKNKIELIQQKAQKALYYNTFIQLIDNEKAIIENCKRIVECNDILVKLVTRNFYIEIWGQNLTINDYNSESIVVNGKITTIELSPKGKVDVNDI